LLKIIAILLTFPVSVPILAGVSYANRGSINFYKPDSHLVADQIDAEIQHRIKV